MLVYVVIGRLGEYSDATEWPARAFADKARAEAWAAAAQEHIARLAADEDFVERVDCYDAAAPADLDALSRYDERLVYTIERGPNAGKRTAGSWNYCGSGPKYGVQPVTLDEGEGPL